MVTQSGGEAGETPNPTNVGGQAVIEGVMMRAPGALSIVCRRRDGSLAVRERTIEAPAGGWVKLPFFRGMYTLVSSLKLGHQALRWSADLFEEDLEAEEREAQKAKAAGVTTGKAPAAKRAEGEGKRSAPPGAVSSLLLGVARPLLLTGEEEPIALKEPGGPKAKEKKGGGLAMLIPIALALTLFVALPQAAAKGVDSIFDLGLDVRAPLFQVLTGGAKLLIIVSYLSLLRLIPDVKRVFQYHGAEHKAISTYEMGKDLVVENARGTTALHARCGTTFIIMVAFVSVVVFAVTGSFLPPLPGSEMVQNVMWFVMKLPLLPVIAGITFELQRFFARYCSTGPLRALLWPGFLVQKITTAPPDDDQLEIALASLRTALANAKVTLPKDHPDKQFSSYATLVSDPVYHG